MGGNPCRFKALLNGETIQNELRSICYQIQDKDISIDDESLYKMVEMLNHAEDLVLKSKRVLCESQGFHGTEEQGGWPHSLDFKKP